MNIHSIVRQINRDLVPQFEEKLRLYLQDQDKDWLVEQIVRLTLDAHSLQENDRKRFIAEQARRRTERSDRLKELELCEAFLVDFLEQYSPYTRESLIQDGFLLPTAPPKGSDLITTEHRTEDGNKLLLLAKDLLFGLLYGDTLSNTAFNRIEREMLTLTLPLMKSDALDFMKATTEFNALGTWQDPTNISNDSRADNIILEVEFGEVDGEWIGKGIVLALSLINNLEVNEQILYGRMINVEQSTLIS